VLTTEKQGDGKVKEGGYDITETPKHSRDMVEGGI
jgi:hypothetical protein